MHIGIAFDLKADVAAVRGSAGPDDSLEEYDSPETVDAIARTLTSLGHRVSRLGGLLLQVPSWPVAALTAGVRFVGRHAGLRRVVVCGCVDNLLGIGLFGPLGRAVVPRDRGVVPAARRRDGDLTATSGRWQRVSVSLR